MDPKVASLCTPRAVREVARRLHDQLSAERKESLRKDPNCITVNVTVVIAAPLIWQEGDRWWGRLEIHSRFGLEAWQRVWTDDDPEDPHADWQLGKWAPNV
jgi:hypothetical protein